MWSEDFAMAKREIKVEGTWLSARAAAEKFATTRYRLQKLVDAGAVRVRVERVERPFYKAEDIAQILEPSHESA